ncbi:MAG: glycosyltransferase family 39 protein [Acidobacteria bacterium]|nr:glycosyltransferase family 39 protein [Acidobacteriota bacterium]MBS1865242.1 glycosyltransferase family 39 protein [Acidobacteriota bacterium]
MTNEHSTIDSANSLSTAARFGWAVMIFVTLAVCYFSNLGTIGFAGPDEPRYAWIARDMAETGDWVTPRLYGKPWFEKPVLYYWMAAASFKLFGVSEAAARLPSAICALFATLALAWLAWRVYGEETARWLLLLLPTSVGMIGFSHAASTDMPFSGMVTIAMVCAAFVLGLARNENTPILPRTPWLALLLFGFFLGLAVLAKGPAGVILCGGGVFFWAIFTERWRDAFRLLHPVAIAAFCATALPWYILCARRNPDFFRIFIIEHNFKRYLTPEFQHIQPFWYYAPVLLVELLPWSLIAVGLFVAWCTDKSRFDIDAKTCFLLSWVLFCGAFFSVSKSKLPGYVLPALPAIVLLASSALSSSRRIYSRMGAAGSLATGVIFGMIALLPVLISSRRNSFVALPFIGGLFAAFAIANLILFAASLKRFSFTARMLAQMFAAVPLLLLFAGVSKAANHHWFWVKSPRAVAAALSEENILIQNLRTFHLRRDTQYALSFYLHAEITGWENDKIADGYLLTDGRSCKELDARLGCENVWDKRDFGNSIWSLLKIKREISADRSAGGGQAQQEK